jgi:hypothetical protein
MMFTHGGEIGCQNCDGNLECATRNYSGTSQDIGQCEECGRGFVITYGVVDVVHEAAYDGESRKEKERAVKALAEKAKLARYKLYQDLQEEFNE